MIKWGTILGSRGKGQVEWCKWKRSCIYPVIPLPVSQKFFPQGVNSPEFLGCTWGGTYHYRLVCLCNLYKYNKNTCSLFVCFFFFHSFTQCNDFKIHSFCSMYEQWWSACPNVILFDPPHPVWLGPVTCSWLVEHGNGGGCHVPAYFTF